MTTKELIEDLQELDPEGTKRVIIDGMEEVSGVYGGEDEDGDEVIVIETLSSYMS